MELHDNRVPKMHDGSVDIIADRALRIFHLSLRYLYGGIAARAAGESSTRHSSFGDDVACRVNVEHCRNLLVGGSKFSLKAAYGGTAVFGTGAGTEKVLKPLI